MRIILIIFIFCSVNFVSSQETFENLLTKISHYNSISEIDSLLKQRPKKKTTDIYSYRQFSRDVGLGYDQNRYYLNVSFTINVLSKNGVVKFGWLSEIDNNEIIRTELIDFSQNEIQIFLKSHNNEYHSSFTTEDLRIQMISEYEVSIECGMKGNVKSKEAKKMLRYVKQKNTAKLNELLVSFSPELRALGIIGLLKVGDLNEKQKLIIDNLLEKDTIISYCMGCLGSYDNYETVVNFYNEKASR